MSEPTQSEDVVINRPDGTEAARWHKLTPAEFIELSRAVKKIRKRECAENLGTLGINGAASLRVLNECDGRVVSHADTVKLVNTLEGQAEILLVAIRRAHKTATYDRLNDLGIGPEEWQQHAAKLMDVELVPVKEGAGNDPLAGDKSGAIETGGAKPPSSGDSAESQTP